MTTTTLRAGTAHPVVDQLLRRARLELDAADSTDDSAMRFLHAHMAAIRSASAVLALRALGSRRRGRPRSVWEQLADAGEEWERWAARFEVAAQLRAAIDAGRIGELDGAVADDAVWAADEFVADVAAAARTAGHGHRAADSTPLAS